VRSPRLEQRDFQNSLKKDFGKKLAQFLSTPCRHCGKERLLSAVDYYTGKKQKCVRCQVTSYMIWPIIVLVFRKLSIPQETAKKIVNDPLLQRTMMNLIKGIAFFGVQIPQPTRVPAVIVWNFTNRCNLQCLHCHQSSTTACAERELTTSEAFSIVDTLSDSGVSILTFSGGEPLARSDIFDVIKRATDKGLYCTIASNGTLMTPEVVDKLHRSGIRRVEIGLDGVKAETHDFLRNKKGCFNATVEGIKNCVRHQYFDEIAITTTLYQSNVHEIPQIIDYAESLGGTRFYLNRLIPAGRGREITHLDVSPEEKKNVLRHLHQRFDASVTNGRGIQCYARGMTYLSRVGYEESKGTLFTVSEAFSGYENMFQKKFGVELPKIVRHFSKSFSGCSAGLTYCGLSAEGDILPCVPAPIAIGNLLREDLEDIWANDKNLHRMRDRKNLQGSCGHCHFNGLCGGCRYTALFLTKDWLGPDLSCPYEPLPQTCPDK
jgi:radical SAM protein with 4Fe4S-binding SPASM domain